MRFSTSNIFGSEYLVKQNVQQKKKFKRQNLDFLEKFCASAASGLQFHLSQDKI